jgi:hypothetical protein
MTVCIAAACLHDGERRIVCCSDWQTTSSLGSAESHFKMRSLPHKWACLSAGYHSDILAIYQLLKAKFRAQTEITEVNNYWNHS